MKEDDGLSRNWKKDPPEEGEIKRTNGCLHMQLDLHCVY
jgi:hypothetical protein